MIKATNVLLAASTIKHSLRLPRLEFPPRPQPALRQTLLKQCTADLYDWQLHDESRETNSPFILHDGPPYANGSLHIGHALNKILKDVFNRFHLSQGRRVHYVPGWDCHGLPIELKALQQKDAKENLSPLAIRRAAEKLATKTIKEQMSGFKAWAIMGDWDNAYKTMDKTFELRQLEVIRAMVEKGLIYRQHKPVYWSPSSGTALAEAELEYDESHISQAAFVKFKLISRPHLSEALGSDVDFYALIWTTTPWTLPANKAIAVHRDLEYSIVQIEGLSDAIIVASQRLDSILRAKDLNVSSVTTIPGEELVGLTYRNPLAGAEAQEQHIIHADFVSAESGSGLVHSAPGHGFDDYNICQNLDAFAPVDDFGRFTREALPDDPASLEGKEVLDEGSQAVLEILQHQGLVWGQHAYKHKYPIDWRTKLPLIVRATAQWFADVGHIKQDSMQALEEVRFHPESGKSRLQNFVSGRSNWCISRQRAWGVPIPALYRTDGDQTEAVMTSDSVAHIIAQVKERGIESWWRDEPDDPRWVSPKLPRGSYSRGKDTLDVWFDSGTTWTQLPQAFSSPAPADVYLEGSDQHRGWFQSSLLTRVAYLSTTQNTNDPAKMPRAPYKMLMTHGFTLDGEGRKMSKSLGNVIEPDQIVSGDLFGSYNSKSEKHSAAKKTSRNNESGPGIDALRLWVVSNDYTRDVNVGEPVVKAAYSSLHKYRVTLRWLLGVLRDYSPTSTGHHGDSLSERLARHHLTQTSQAVHAAYTAYEPFKAMKALDRYIFHDLSGFYFETAKDSLYTGLNSEREDVLSACYDIFQELLAMLAPVTPLLVAEALHYRSEPLKTIMADHGHDPFHRTWTPYNSASAQQNTLMPIQREQQILTTLSDAVKRALEEVRTQKLLGQSLECNVTITLAHDTSSDLEDWLQIPGMLEELARALVVSKVSVNNPAEPSISAAQWHASRDFSDGDAGLAGTITVLPADGGKCVRCWRWVVSPEDKEARDDGHSVCTRCSGALKEMGIDSLKEEEKAHAV